MRRFGLSLFGAAAGFVPMSISSAAMLISAPPPAAVSPVYGVAVPEGYRGWELITPALEDAPLDELRVVLANPVAVDAFKRSGRPFPDGSTLVKLAWKRTPSAEFASATVPGADTDIHAGGIDTLAAMGPLRRVAPPEEIAGLVADMVNDQAGYMAGASVTIDGGFTL